MSKSEAGFSCGVWSLVDVDTAAVTSIDLVHAFGDTAPVANKFLAHRREDSVGVATDAISAGETVKGMVLEDGSGSSVKALEDIPYGHKLALIDIEEGATVVEYGQPIGRAVASIRRGEHVHVHNIKSNRF